LVIVVGLCVGSFLNVVIYRLPAMLHRNWQRDCRELLDGPAEDEAPVPNLVQPGSSCPHCGARIRAHENIPLLSWILLRARCAHCGEPIAVRYPLVELLGAAAMLAAFWQFGLTAQGLAASLFGWAMIVLLFIDLEHKLLPDAVTLPLMWAGLLVNATPHGFAPVGAAVIGAAAGYLVLWTVYQAFRLLTGKEGMGYGDFKLLAAIGAWLGWQYLPLVVLLSSAVGAVVGIVALRLAGKGRDHPLPFGPFLAVAGWIALFAGDRIIATYLQFVGMSG
jgi:leader peptidase (prepilin peptidase)/N-methyltransferase